MINRSVAKTQLRKVTIENFRKFSRLQLSTENAPVTIIVGNNGAGKSSILDAIATGLGWLVSRIHREKGKGPLISEKAIKNGESHCSIQIELEEESKSYQWKLVRTGKGKTKKEESRLTELNTLAEYYRESLHEPAKGSLPLFAYYPVTRAVMDISWSATGHQSYDELAGYHDTLKGRSDFQQFFEWFHARENIENSEVIGQLLADLKRSDATPERIAQALQKQKDSQLEAVRRAIGKFMPGFDNLRIQRKPELQMLIDKDGEALDILQLSDGERCLLAMVGDLARRLAMINPNMENPLEGQGIILIDEIDLHLHPKWQRTVIHNLITTFPNCQFFITTHSPQVLGDANNANVYLLDEDQEEALQPIQNVFGKDSNQVLLEIMNTEIRNPAVQSQLDDLFAFIQKKELKKATSLLKQLQKLLGPNDLELLKASIFLKRMRLRDEKRRKAEI